MTHSQSLFGRFRRNVLGYGYSQVVTLAVQLVLIPFFLGYWGTELYANWLVLTGIPIMLTLLDLGVAQSLASTATSQASGGEVDAATVSLQTALAFTLCLCILILLLACIATSCIDWPALLGLGSIDKSDASFTFLLMVIYLCAGLMGGPLDAWFRTIDRAPASAFLLANRRTLDVVISVGVLVLGGGVVMLAAAMAFGQLIAMVLLYWLAVRWSPWKVLGLTEASWSVFSRTLKPAIAYMGFPVSQVVTLQGGLQMLNQVAAPSVVVSFTMARTLMRLIMQAGVVVNNAMKPEIARLAGQGRVSEARRFSRMVSPLVLGVCTAVYLVLVALGPDVIEWWGHGKVSAERLDLALIGIHALVNVAWFIPAATLIAINRHMGISVVYGLASCLSLAGWVVLADRVPPILGASLVLLLPELLASVTTRFANAANRISGGIH